MTNKKENEYCECDCCNHCECDYDDCCDCNEFEEMPSFPMIGERAPEFVANSTNGKIVFPDDYAGKWVIFFSHPADFTPVCTTEFLTFSSRQSEFKKLNCELVGLSIDSLHSHIAWLKKIETLTYKDIKNQKITFPVIDDISMEVANLYGMIHPLNSSTHAVRAVFIIDPKGIIRTVLYYPSSTGRNFDELIRILEALQYSDKKQIATPADWKKGDDVIVPPAQNIKEANDRSKEKVQGMECQDWFFCFKKFEDK